MDCRYRKTERVGLYLMVMFCWLHSCSADRQSGEALELLRAEQAQ